MDTADIPRIIKEAFHIATTGRPGPVLIDIPRDVLVEKAEFEYPEQVKLDSYKPTLDGHAQQIKRAARLIREAHRPLILAGHGVVISRAFDELREVAEKAQIPVVTTLLGLGGFPGDHVLHLGMPGMHGQAHVNWAIHRSDLIVAAGMRFDDRVTGKLSAFAPNAKVVHIDIDPAEVGKNVRVSVPIVGDAKRVLHALAKEIEPATRPDWLREIDELRERHPFTVAEDGRLLPQHVVRELSAATDGRALVVTGVGQHQMFAAQHYTFRDANSWITSGGLGTMGFEVPAAMGAAFASPGRTVWSICGDSGFQMTMSDVATIAEHKLPVKFAIFNNGGNLGLVRQLQDLFYQRTRVAVDRTGDPDFVKLAEAYGIWAARVTERDQVRSAIEQAMAVEGPALIDFHVDPEENVYPHVPAGESVAEMIEGTAPEDAPAWLK